MIERSSGYNPTSNSSAERNLGILKRLLAKSAHSGEDFAKQLFALQNMPHTTGGLSPARLFFQHQVRTPLLYQPRCDKDEHAAGLQHHYDREKSREVWNAKKGNLSSPLDLYVGQRVFLQDEMLKNKPYSIPGRVIEVRDNGRSAFVWAPGRRKKYLRNCHKMMLQVNTDDDDKESSEDGVDNADMIEEEEMDLGGD